MQAAIINKWGNAAEFQVVETPVPVAKQGEVLVNIQYASLNPVDYKMRNGRFKWLMSPRFPKVLGLEASGYIAHTDTPVYVYLAQKFRLGCYAEYVAVPDAFVFRLPANFDLRIGSGLSVAPVTALQAIRDHGQIRKGSKVLINGASGSVGLCAVQIARNLGAEVTGVCSTRNIELVKSYGACHVIDYTRVDFTQLPDQFDLVLDCISNRSFKECQPILTSHGQYINLMLRPLDLVWQRIRNPFSKQKYKTILMKYRPSDIQSIIDQVQEQKIKIPFDSEFNLADIKAAQERLESGRALGKIYLNI